MCFVAWGSLEIKPCSLPEQPAIHRTVPWDVAIWLQGQSWSCPGEVSIPVKRWNPRDQSPHSGDGGWTSENIDHDGNIELHQRTGVRRWLVARPQPPEHTSKLCFHLCFLQALRSSWALFPPIFEKLGFTICLNLVVSSFLLDWKCTKKQGLGYVTSEKITPSPLNIVAEIGRAIEFEQKFSASRRKVPLKDGLNKVIADYNKMTTLKRHRIDSLKRAMCYNLLLSCTIWLQLNTILKCFASRLRCPPPILEMLHKHYDSYRHEQSGTDWSFVFCCILVLKS